MDWLDKALIGIEVKMQAVRERSAEKIPMTAVEGVHDNKREGTYAQNDGLSWWTNGFWGGMLWQLYAFTGEDAYKDVAKKTEVWLDKALADFMGLHHDVGFMWIPTALANYRLTGNRQSKVRSLHAANLLAGRFNMEGKFIRAWNDIPGQDKDTRGWTIIDSMLNIPLLYWASEETKDPRYAQIAIAHAETLQKHFVRSDGSVEHIVEFNPNTGEVVRSYGGQGYERGSAWTRGQSWGLYGFFMSYKHTGRKDFLDTAVRIARYIISEIPEDGLINVDFRQPEMPRLMDDTAAAIIACGLIEISRQFDGHKALEFYTPAIKILQALDAEHCDYNPETDTFLTHCSNCYHYHKHHHPLVYADYFYLEALLKLKNDGLYIW